MIGDPSGKIERAQAARRTTRSGEQHGQDHARRSRSSSPTTRGPPVKMVNNLDWLGSVRLLEFLRDIGKHFAVNQMIQRDSVKQRFESREEGISYTEFSYMLLQAYDFLELHRRHGCRLQSGASDQWGNIVSGVDLVRRLEGKTGLRPDRAAADRQRGEEVRQEREGRGVPRPEADVALRLLSVLAQHRGRQRGAVPALADRPRRARRSRRSRRRRAPSGGPAGAGRGSHPPRPRRRRAAEVCARRRRCSAAAICARIGGDLLDDALGGGAVDHRRRAAGSTGRGR